MTTVRLFSLWLLQMIELSTNQKTNKCNTGRKKLGNVLFSARPSPVNHLISYERVVFGLRFVVIFVIIQTRIECRRNDRTSPIKDVAARVIENRLDGDPRAASSAEISSGTGLVFPDMTRLIEAARVSRRRVSDLIKHS